MSNQPSPLDLARETFAVRGDAQLPQLLREQCELDSDTAQRCAEDVRALLVNEFAAERTDPKPNATAFYRLIKGNKQASWAARVTAQVRIDELWNLIERAEDATATGDPLVLESYAFYHLVLKAEDASPQTKLRARQRIDYLIGARQKRKRRGEQRLGPMFGPPGSGATCIMPNWPRKDASSHRQHANAGGPCESNRTQPDTTERSTKPTTQSVPAKPAPAASPEPKQALPPSAVANPYDPEHVFTAEEKAGMEQALAAAEPGADPFMVVLNAYLDVKYPDASPASSESDEAIAPFLLNRTLFVSCCNSSCWEWKVESSGIKWKSIR